MKLTHAMLIAGIMTSISGSIGLLTSTVLSASASASGASNETSQPALLWFAEGDVNGADLPVQADGGALSAGEADQAVVVLLARMLHRSETGTVAMR